MRTSARVRPEPGVRRVRSLLPNCLRVSNDPASGPRSRQLLCPRRSCRSMRPAVRVPACERSDSSASLRPGRQPPRHSLFKNPSVRAMFERAGGSYAPVFSLREGSVKRWQSSRVIRRGFAGCGTWEGNSCTRPHGLTTSGPASWSTSVRGDSFSTLTTVAVARTSQTFVSGNRGGREAAASRWLLALTAGRKPVRARPVLARNVGAARLAGALPSSGAASSTQLYDRSNSVVTITPSPSSAWSEKAWNKVSVGSIGPAYAWPTSSYEPRRRIS